ncbi:hypothetical protein B0H13DRAFT_2202767, partial [Mycena leptocephala]
MDLRSAEYESGCQHSKEGSFISLARPKFISECRWLRNRRGKFVLGDVHNHHRNPGPRHSNISFNMDETFSESEIYCNQLLCQKRGFPLYVPGPRRNLPAEYRTNGIAIGDVGRVTPEGIFDFFFNIYLSADHPINDNDVPENFYPLPRYATKDVFDLDFEPGNSLRRLTLVACSEFPGSDFVFSCGIPNGAVLALPHGAHLDEKLENLVTLRSYVATHAENWYKYVNGARGRGLTNGSLYLVT